MFLRNSVSKGGRSCATHLHECVAGDERSGRREHRDDAERVGLALHQAGFGARCAAARIVNQAPYPGTP